MMQYNHLGLYVSRKRRAKLSVRSEKQSVDWINVMLLGLLVVVVVLFVVMR